MLPLHHLRNEVFDRTSSRDASASYSKSEPGNLRIFAAYANLWSEVAPWIRNSTSRLRFLQVMTVPEVSRCPNA